ncbi:MAG: hypothetical protein LBE06_01185, partial [Azoarcus sp.]|nr:hypothetical protein [Azoarcus sp.]
MTRGRKPLAAKHTVELSPEGAANFDADFRAAQNDIIAADMLEAEACDRSMALAVRVGYELPAGELNADLIQRDIAANMRRSVESVLDIGRGLLVLKSLCGHGDFQERISSTGCATWIRIVLTTVGWGHERHGLQFWFTAPHASLDGGEDAARS